MQCATRQYRLSTTAAYDRAVRKFLRKHPALRARYYAALRLLSSDPYDRRLGLHERFATPGYYSISLSHAYRLIVTISGDAVTLHTVGDHDAVYPH